MESAVRMASEISRDLMRNQVNCIVIVPPKGAPEKLFDLLSDVGFHEQIHGKSCSELAIAKIERAHFRSEECFLLEAARQFGVSITEDVNAAIQLRLIVDKVAKKGRRPVLLVPRFHEAMERLGEDFGSALRELDKASCISTIVEFPVNHLTLKAHWDSDTNKGVFLNSDWGDSHQDMFLSGYTRDEVIKIAKQSSNNSWHLDDAFASKAEFLFDCTGGIPELVDHLVRRLNDSSFESYKMWVQSQSTNLCVRLLKWLDIPGSFTYTRLVASSLSKSNPTESKITLASHSWGRLLLGKDGLTGCKLLAWACINRLAESDEANYCLSIRNSIRDRRVSEYIPQLTYLSNKGSPNWEYWKFILLLSRFSCASDPFSPDLWLEASNHLKALENLADASRNKDMLVIVEKIVRDWHTLVARLSGFMKLKDRYKFNTLEQYICAELKEDDVVAYLAFLSLKLRIARQNPSPYLSLRSVVELPEALFQVFCKSKFKISIWNPPEFSCEDIERIKKLTNISYDSAKAGKSYGFMDMLCLNLLKSTDQPLDQTLVRDEAEFRHLLEMYSKGRSITSHGTAGIVDSDWDDYYERCIQLVERAKIVLLGTDASINLLNPEVILMDLLKKPLMYETS